MGWILRDYILEGSIIAIVGFVVFIGVWIWLFYRTPSLYVVDVEFDDEHKILILTKVYTTREEEQVEIPYSQAYVNAYYNPMSFYPYTSLEILHCENPDDEPIESYWLSDRNFNRRQLEKLLIRLLEVSANSEESKQDIRNALPQD